MNAGIAVWIWLVYLVLSFLVWPTVFRTRFGRWPFAYAFPPRDSLAFVDSIYAFVLILYTFALLFGDALSAQSVGGGVAVFALGYALQMWAIFTMGRHWRFGHDPKEEPAEYITYGPFALLKHPIYASLIVISVAMGLLAGFDGRAALLIVGSCVYFGVQGRAETLLWKSLIAGDENDEGA